MRVLYGFSGASFPPLLHVGMQTAFIIVDENAGDVHGIHQRQPFPDTTFTEAGDNLRCDIENARRAGLQTIILCDMFSFAFEFKVI